MVSTKPSNQAKHPKQPPQSTDLGRKLVGNNRGLTQAYQLRDLSAGSALALKDEPLDEGETKASRAQAICALVRAWEGTTQVIRIMRGKPLPGSLRPERKPPKKKQQRAIPSEQPDSPDSPDSKPGSNPA